LAQDRIVKRYEPAISVRHFGIGTELAATPGADRPAKVIIAILTGGEENSSRHFSMADHCCPKQNLLG
jgi:hypothetical protein